MGSEVLDADAKFECDIKFAADSIAKRRLQITAMDQPVRRAETAFHFIAKRNAHNLAARAASHNPDALRLDCYRCETLAEPQRNQDAAPIGRQLETGAGLFQFFGLLVH